MWFIIKILFGDILVCVILIFKNGVIESWIILLCFMCNVLFILVGFLLFKLMVNDIFVVIVFYFGEWLISFFIYFDLDKLLIDIFFFIFWVDEYEEINIISKVLNK